MASHFRAVAQKALGIFGLAPRIEKTARRDVLLQSKRDVLAAAIERAKRNHRPVKHLHKEAYSITHEILRRGR